MRLRQYQSNDVEIAVRLARAELGEDAMLVTVEQAKAGDAKGARYRVTFASQVTTATSADIFMPGVRFADPRPRVEATLQHRKTSEWTVVRHELSRLAQELDCPVSILETCTPATIPQNLQPTPRPPGGQCTAIIGSVGCGKSTAIEKLAFREARSGRIPVIVRAFQPVQELTPKLVCEGVLQLGAGSIAELDSIVERIPRTDLILFDISSITAEPNWPTANAFRRWLMANGVTLHLAVNAISSPTRWRSDIVQFRWFEPAFILLSHIEQVGSWDDLLLSVESTGLDCSYLSGGAAIDSPIELSNPEQLHPVSRAASAN